MADTLRDIYDQGELARRLREKGFVPLPRLWVKSSDMDKVHAIAQAHSHEVNQTREQLQREREVEKIWAEREAS
jgi:hypothetical protein